MNGAVTPRSGGWTTNMAHGAPATPAPQNKEDTMTRIHQSMRQALAAAALVTAAAATTAPAADAGPPAGLSPAEITRKVEAAGYTNVHELEFDDGRWELDATSPAGVAVSIDVD